MTETRLAALLHECMDELDACRDAVREMRDCPVGSEEVYQESLLRARALREMIVSGLLDAEAEIAAGYHSVMVDRLG